MVSRYSLTLKEFLLIAAFGLFQTLTIPFAEFRSDDSQTLSALRAIVSGDVFPLFWQGDYPVLPHGVLNAYLYLPLFLLWPSVLSPFVTNVILNCLSCVFFLLISKRLGWRDAGIVAATLFMLNPTFFGFQAQSIWNITVILSVSMACWYSLVVYLQSSQRTYLFVSGVLAGLLPYAHVLGFLHISVYLVILARAPLRDALIAVLIVFILCAPFGWVLYRGGGFEPTVWFLGFGLFLLYLCVLSIPQFKRLSDKLIFAGFLMGALYLIYTLFVGKEGALTHLFRLVDSVHSYNLSSLSDTRSFASEYLPRCERMFWIIALIVALFRWTRVSIGKRIVWVFSVVPVALFDVLASLVPGEFRIMHHRVVPFFPIQLLFLASPLELMPRAIGRFLGGLLISLVGVAAVTFLATVPFDGRPTVNGLMLGERFTITRFAAALGACDTVSLLGRAGDVYEASLWQFIEAPRSSFRPNCDVAPRQNFIVAATGVQGWSMALEREVMLSSLLVESRGRLRFYRGKTGAGRGLVVLPPTIVCKPQWKLLHGFPIIDRPIC